MPKTLSFMGFELPKVSPTELHRFEPAARIKDPVKFAAELDALIQEKMAAAEQAAAGPADVRDQLADKARALRAETRWTPSATDLQRGRSAMLRVFEAPQNLPLTQFARLADKSRQQIYKDLSAHPRRLLALSVGPRKQRLPEWQLDPVRLNLTRQVLKLAEDLDPWTLFRALSDPLDALDGRSPVDAVTAGNLDEIVAKVRSALGLHERARA